MCGIAGILTRGASPSRERLVRMLKSLEHRGPDGSGLWVDGPVGLVHTRLAIIEPSAASAQPMVGADGRSAISFNGEIYNYQQLRSELVRHGHRFSTSSDTEVFLAGFAREGPKFFERLEGMFAAAIWDGVQLILVRDRFGMKPLFYTDRGHELLFGSEPKALLAGGATAQLRAQGLLEYLLLNTAQGLGCMYQGMTQVEPGGWIAVRPGQTVVTNRYWDIPVPTRPASRPWRFALDDARHILDRAIRRHLVSDRPVGVYLSGGIDSSLIASAAAAAVPRLRSFWLGFDATGDDAYQRFAERIAERFGMTHVSVIAKSSDVPELLDEMNTLADEPQGDAADVAVYALSKVAREQVRVVLTGDGGDEVFGGYRRHRGDALARRVGWLARAAQPLGPWLGDVNRRRLRLLATAPAGERYASSLMSLPEPRREAALLIHPELRRDVDVDAVFDQIRKPFHRAAGLSAMLVTDLRTILSDSYLRKTDRACMMAGVEGRLPYLDRELVEFAFGLPASALVGAISGKRILRKLLRERIPDSMTTAPKAGFNVPFWRWLADGRMRELRMALAEPTSALSSLVSSTARDILTSDPGDPQHAATQWKLLRLGLWAQRWLRDPYRDAVSA
jgi:asparagine synthase (glutamine-hydrolysing)